MTSVMCLSGEAMSQVCCLAVAIYFEARGEPLAGQYTVGQVVLNRVEDERYPNTVCDVVFEDKQFSFTHDGKPDRLPRQATRASQRAIEVASDLLYDVRVPTTSTHYHTVSVKPYWAPHYEMDAVIGKHIFYTNNTRDK